MKVEALLHTIARKATRLLRSWGINKSIVVVKGRRPVPTYWGDGHWWKPTHVFCTQSGEVGAYCDLLQTIRTYCGIHIDWKLGESYCRRVVDNKILHFPIHFFIALHAFFGEAAPARKGEYWGLWASQNHIKLVYCNGAFLVLTIYSYRKAKLEEDGKVLVRGTLRQVMRHFLKTLAVGSL